MQTLSIVIFTVAAAATLAPAFLAPRRFERARRSADIRREIGISRERIAILRNDLAAGRIPQDQCEQQEHELAHDLLRRTAALQSAAVPHRASRRQQVLAIGALVAVAGIALAGHFVGQREVGTPTVLPASSVAMAPSSQVPASMSRAAHALSDEQIQHMIDATRARVLSSPRDIAAWAMLAHSYDMLGKFAESSAAYATLAQLAPNDAQVLADYADALGVANGRTLAGMPATLIRSALAIDPRNVKALTLAGMQAYEHADYASATTQWEQARALSHDPAIIRQIDLDLASAGASGKPVATAATPASAGGAISGRVSLADDLRAKANPDATVFIFARPVDGSRMPVALLRRHVRDLPLDFTLDDSMSMVRDVRLSQSSMVIVAARVSQRGDVTPAPGDLQGTSAPMRVGSTDVRLEISEVLR